MQSAKVWISIVSDRCGDDFQLKYMIKAFISKYNTLLLSSDTVEPCENAMKLAIEEFSISNAKATDYDKSGTHFRCFRLWTTISSWSFEGLVSSKIEGIDNRKISSTCYRLAHLTYAIISLKEIAASLTHISESNIIMLNADLPLFISMCQLSGNLKFQASAIDYINLLNGKFSCPMFNEMLANLHLKILVYCAWVNEFIVAEEKLQIDWANENKGICSIAEVATLLLSDDMELKSRFDSMARKEFEDSLYDTLQALKATANLFEQYSMWTLLLGAKVMWLRFRSVSCALRLCKVAMTMKRQKTTPENALPQFECFLFMAELRDMAGSVDGCLVSLSEAQCIAELVDTEAVRNTLALQACRIYYRCSSARLAEALSCLVKSASEAHKSDWVSTKIYPLAVILSKLLAGAKISAKQLDLGIQALSATRFRHLNEHWNVSGLRSGNRNEWHSFLRSDRRSQLESLFRRLSLSRCESTMSTAVDNPTVPSQGTELLAEMKLLEDLPNFDVLRDIRRQLCLNLVITPGSNSSRTARAFALGAQSCFTSLECSADRSSTLLSRSGPGSFDDNLKTVARAISGDEAKLSELEQQVEECLRRMNSINHSPNSAVAFIVYVSAQQCLLVGHRDLDDSVVFAIPVGNKITDLQARWAELVEQSRSFLKQVNVELASSSDSRQKEKDWWKVRNRFDADIVDILSELEGLLAPWKPCLSEVQNRSKMRSGGPGESLDSLLEQFEALKVADLQAELKKRDLQSAGKKSILASRLAEHEFQKHQEQQIYKAKEKVLGHLALIVDESLGQFPWESLSMLKDLSVSRIPNLTVLLTLLSAPNIASALECENAEVFRKGWYALDIEANLPRTKEVMGPYLEGLAAPYEWKSVVGSIPDEDTIRKLHEESNVFVFCGHGAGEKMCDTFHFRKMRCPAALLWGCSSGKLRVHGIHDPTGACLFYLLGGAPFALGNLWDVTDKDIDKLCMRCMDLFLPAGRDSNENEASHVTSISAALSKSREVCKLRHAVGSAPVVYGIPIAAEKSCKH